MMGGNKICVFLMSAALLGSPAFTVAATSPAAKQQQTVDARQVLRASPMDDIIAQYPTMMSQGIRDGLKQTGQVPPMVADAVGYVVSNSFNSQKIEQQVAGRLQAELSNGQLQAVADWYNTPVAQKISRAEVAALAPVVWPQISAQAGQLAQRFGNTDRAKSFVRFNRASRATQSAVDTTIAVQLGLASTMAAFSSDSANFETLQKRIESQRPALKGVVEQQVFNSYLYAYQDISGAEMEQYLRFLESDAGAAFTRVVSSGVKQAVIEPVESIGEQLSQFLAP
ncbi:hypothetical protein ABA45_13385 [Marinobacter psychrophilus]|uniref:DUF2059 domain-containing protein n=1 Tax=Marinobacter psychrophilus TaxID=330734 RepID=A0A0H4IE96_9GAMM|nr:DUF2059 domain-containing protein [Marinobacter psychrophilus]AKO53287.1 hypothetical protein ABA45_13385 [Marinobacter psychrophilus]